MTSTETAVSRLTDPDPRLQELTQDQVRALMSPINSGRVKRNRDGFSYIEAWDVKATLIRIFGFGGWSADVVDWRELSREQVPQRNQREGQPKKMNWKTVVAVTLRLTIHQTGATYSEVAIGTSSQPDIDKSFDMALKSGESYALKRCAIDLGTQFGLSLYNNGALADVVRVVFAPGQERNIPWAAPEEISEADIEKQAQIDRAFSVQPRAGSGGHEDSPIEEPESFPEPDADPTDGQHATK